MKAQPLLCSKSWVDADNEGAMLTGNLFLTQECFLDTYRALGGSFDNLKTRTKASSHGSGLPVGVGPSHPSSAENQMHCGSGSAASDFLKTEGGCKLAGVFICTAASD